MSLPLVVVIEREKKVDDRVSKRSKRLLGRKRNPRSSDLWNAKERPRISSVSSNEMKKRMERVEGSPADSQSSHQIAGRF